MPAKLKDHGVELPSTIRHRVLLAVISAGVAGRRVEDRPDIHRPGGADEEDLAFVRTIVDLGHILGLRVVAEGIEDEAQLGALRGLGCGLGQGFLLSRPADVANVPEILARQQLTSTPAAAVAVG